MPHTSPKPTLYQPKAQSLNTPALDLPTAPPCPRSSLQAKSGTSSMLSALSFKAALGLKSSAGQSTKPAEQDGLLLEALPPPVLVVCQQSQRPLQECSLQVVSASHILLQLPYHSHKVWGSYWRHGSSMEATHLYTTRLNMASTESFRGFCYKMRMSTLNGADGQGQQGLKILHSCTSNPWTSEVTKRLAFSLNAELQEDPKSENSKFWT